MNDDPRHVDIALRHPTFSEASQWVYTLYFGSHGPADHLFRQFYSATDDHFVLKIKCNIAKCTKVICRGIWTNDSNKLPDEVMRKLKSHLYEHIFEMEEKLRGTQEEKW
jgi:hypothetical protein